MLSIAPWAGAWDKDGWVPGEGTQQPDRDEASSSPTSLLGAGHPDPISAALAPYAGYVNTLNNPSELLQALNATQISSLVLQNEPTDQKCKLCHGKHVVLY